jgi:hypothetical protein
MDQKTRVILRDLMYAAAAEMPKRFKDIQHIIVWLDNTPQALGGRARAKKLSPERRSEIAKHTVTAREAKRGVD